MRYEMVEVSTPSPTLVAEDRDIEEECVELPLKEAGVINPECCFVHGDFPLLVRSRQGPWGGPSLDMTKE
jgi:hypothetical protein